MRKAILALIVCLLLSAVLVASQSRSAPIPANRVLVAELLSDAYSAESSMLIKVESEITLDQLVYIEARDGTYHEAVPVMHVFGNYLLLKEHLTQSFLSGSKLYQRR